MKHDQLLLVGFTQTEARLVSILTPLPRWTGKSFLVTYLWRRRDRRSLKGHNKFMAESDAEETKTEAEFQKRINEIYELYPDPEEAKAFVKQFVEYWESRQN